ncbi:hypothetical protein [Variovorax boronicumulans]|uniref:hypothetical protein n=1 Tax=Variovorax boronicumulans TaxID=436515 RepID=UPI003396C343
MPAKRHPVAPNKGSAEENAVEQSKQVAEEIKEAADDLVVVHAVLDKELTDKHRSSEVDQAVAHTEKIEKRLSKSAKALDEVNRKLEGKKAGTGQVKPAKR